MRIIKTPLSTGQDALALNYPLVANLLTRFIRQELAWRGFERAVVAVSGGVDSAVTLALAARALEPGQVFALALPHHDSQSESLLHAQMVCEAFGVELSRVDITPIVVGYTAKASGLTPRRRGNLMARARMMVTFDQSEALHALPLGTGNKTERLFGYFTWHADDTPPVNPLGDLYKTQIWGLADYLGVPEVIVNKAPTADLEPQQTDEADLGLAYRRADAILDHYLRGYPDAYLEQQGYTQAELELVKQRVNRTHWKRALPTVAMLSATAIGEYYLRPLDFRIPTQALREGPPSP